VARSSRSIHKQVHRFQGPPDWLRSKQHNISASPRPDRRMSATAQSGPSPLDLPPPFEPLDDELLAIDELAVAIFPGSRFVAEGP
jgi:hypothetical protein